MSFPVLYQTDKNGKTRIWKIQVRGNVITTEYGLKDGKLIVSEEVIKKGKNLGKKNETTPEEQAYKEAESKWTKKVDVGYSAKGGGGAGKGKAQAAAASPASPKKKNGLISPMLAHKYEDHKHKMDFPCYTQPKLDGYRCVYDGFSDRILSRGNKEFSVLYGTPLHEELQKYKNVILDGELYVHNKDYAFENYGVLRKKNSPTDEDMKKIARIKYHVYDIIDTKLPYKDRLAVLNKILVGNKYIHKVETKICHDHSCIDKNHAENLKQNYEGTMIRNMDAVYVGKRTSDLLKYKNFDDDEFKIIGFDHEIDTGDGLTPVVWICITPEGREFNVASKGTRSERDKLYKNGKKYIGKWLSVQFFGYTESGSPRFPRTLHEGRAAIRDKKY